MNAVTGVKKTCFCHTCGKPFHCLGIARHVVGHHERGEDCDVTYTHGDRYTIPAPEWRKEIGRKRKQECQRVRKLGS